MITLENVDYSYEDSPALSDIHLNIERGDSVALIGPNGSGKSTLMKLISGLVMPDSGTYDFDGCRIDKAFLSNRISSKNFHHRIGFLFQNSDIQLFCPTVADELSFGPLQLGIDDSEINARVNDCADLLGITPLLSKVSYHLSDGEKRKVALAAVLSLNPEVLVLDEPLNSLDPKTKRFLNKLLTDLNRAGKTIISSIHDFAYLDGVFNKAVVLSADHRIVRSGSYNEIVGDQDFLIKHNVI